MSRTAVPWFAAGVGNAHGEITKLQCRLVIGFRSFRIGKRARPALWGVCPM